jgi:Zinc carboxypeptidase
MSAPLDRYLRYDELTDELHRLVGDHPDLATIESIGRSHEGRDIWLVTVTDASTGPADAKPAHWVDANIHATEVTGSVAALHLVDHLLTSDDPALLRARATRTFYVVPRVNPDGAEAALADRPRFLRSSTRPWPWRDGSTPPGLEGADIDGDGRILHLRIVDPDGAWKPHAEVTALMVPRAVDDGPDRGPYYRLLVEGFVADHDGFTVPTPRPSAGLDLNRNYPAGWGTAVAGSGDHPLSEPEVSAVVRAMVARPNICGFNAYHTFGGVLLRPSSTKADGSLPPVDLWTWKELGARLTETSGYKVHSVYEDFTWDKDDTMSGASDDWAYEHLGVYGWTTEFWDVIAHATDHRAPTAIWYVGPSVDDELAVYRWFEERYPGQHHVDWYPFEHPQLGAVEIGGWNDIFSWANPPTDLLAAEVAPHADFAVFHALAAPELAVRHLGVTPLGDDTWAVAVGVANVGYLPTDVTAWARKRRLVLPLVVELSGDGVTVADGPARRELGQLEGRVRHRFDAGARNDGTPDRVLERFVVRAPAGTTLHVEARHPRAGRDVRTVVLGG